MIETRVHKKKTRLPITRWTTNIPKRYKRNTIKVAKWVSSKFTNEVTLIQALNQQFPPMRSINSVIHQFTTVQTNENNGFIIPQSQ